ncbi:MAG TPA: hypothetical protein VIA11_04815 [Acidimicrobiia bacterium]|jgi:hypothetical protein|nr:hypothetical protein [Acidimicrobiia bacterium]
MPAAVALALVPLVASAVALIARVGDDYLPSADQAWIELQVRDIGRRSVLLGPYSRFGWFHPGPILYYLLWLPYRITGSSSLSLCFAALTVNAAALVGIALVAKRRGGLPLVLLTLFLTGLLMSSLGAQFFRDVWNPSITILPFVLLVLLAWSISCGEAWALPVGAGVGTFLVQTHVSYGLTTVTVLAGGLVGAAITRWRRRGADEHRESIRWWRRMSGVTVVVLAVLWLPVVIQQLTSDDGNLAALVRFFRDHGREHSYGDAWHVLASQLSVWPDWLRGSIVRNIYSGALDLSGPTPVAVAALLLIGAAVITWRRAKDGFRLDVLVGLAIIAGFVSLSRIVGEIFPYLVIWTWALGMLTWLAISWSVVRWWQTHPAPAPWVGRVALGAVAVALVVVSVVSTVDAARAGNPDVPGSRWVRGLTAKVRDELPDGRGVVEIRSSGGAGSTWIGAGIADELEHDGVDTRVTPDLAFAYGPDRVLDGERVRLVVLPAEDAELAAARRLPCFDDVGRVGKFTLFVRRGPCAAGT